MVSERLPRIGAVGFHGGKIIDKKRLVKPFSLYLTSTMLLIRPYNTTTRINKTTDIQ